MTAATAARTIEDGLIAISSALVLNKRSDGSSCRSISDLHADSETIRSIVCDLHDGELPNDWRYEMVYDLANAFLEYSEPEPEPWSQDEYEEQIPEIAKGLVDVWGSDLLEWAKINSRTEFREDRLFPPSEISILSMLQARQEEEIIFMAHQLLHLITQRF